MNCKLVQELVLTDYSDGQLSAARMRKVDNHLMHCLACRTLFEKVRKNVIDPLKRSMPE